MEQESDKQLNSAVWDKGSLARHIGMGVTIFQFFKRYVVRILLADQGRVTIFLDF
jgi:hypothetical protein